MAVHATAKTAAAASAARPARPHSACWNQLAGRASMGLGRLHRHALGGGRRQDGEGDEREEPGDSPFSLWDWRQYHAGLPDLHVLQYVFEGLLVVGAVVVAFVPRRKSVLQLAALSAAVLLGFEVVLTHWFYAYIAWFFPFVAFAVLSPAAERVPVQATEPHGRPARELVPAG